MQDLFIHELGARRVRWTYDDPSGVPDGPSVGRRIAGERIPPLGETRIRLRRPSTPKAA
ncbi:MAG TPA: hypothetical protein VJ986_02285 [Gaiellaceae bacterium]|nr:hypothetical protein [Gaiellaceae bacterium]